MVLRGSKIWLGLCLCLISLATKAETSIWKVSKNGSDLYLGGTIHLLKSSDYPLPKEFEQAYAKSGTLVFETDSAALKKPELQMQFMHSMMLADGKTINDILSPTTYQALARAAKERSLPLAAMERFNPVAITIQLTVMEMKRLGMNAPGVDDHFYTRAVKDGKKVGTFETPMEQIGFIRDLALGQEDEFVLYSLEDLGAIPKQMTQLISAWRSGDRKALAASGIDEWQSKFPGVYQRLLVDRNQRWLPKIETMLADEHTEFVLVGALHLVGKEGLLQQLQKKGYQIRQL